MNSVTHGVRVIQTNADRTRAMLVQCLCGGIGGLTGDEGWPVVAEANGMVTLNQSVFFVGHFDSEDSPDARSFPVGDVDLSLRKSR